MSSDDDSSELHSTLRELIASFGKAEVALACSEVGLMAEITAKPAESNQHALRAFVLMILDSRHPRSIAQIVARLCELDTAAGREFRQQDIAREIGVTKAQVCNMEATIAKKLNLPRRSSERARQSYREMNLRNYVIESFRPANAAP